LPFERASIHETLDAVAGTAPADFGVLPPEVPSSLVAVLKRMLEKNVAKRYQSARELIADLDRVAAASRARPPEDRRRSIVVRGARLVLLVSAMGASVWAIWTRVAQSPRRMLSLTPFTYYPGYEQNPAISPDGSQIAYVGQGIHGTNPFELYVQAIGSTDPVT
jgi:hypothetical protein